MQLVVQVISRHEALYNFRIDVSANVLQPTLVKTCRDSQYYVALSANVLIKLA